MENNIPKIQFREGMGKAADDVITSQYPYWGALLTFNGILIAIFATRTNNLNNPYIVFALIILALLSSNLIILNFRDRRKWLEDIATIFQMPKEPKEQYEESISVQKKKALNVYNKINRRERWALWLLIPESIIIILLTIPIPIKW